MKIDRLETHDRLEHFKKDQLDNINKGIQDTKKNPLYLAIQDRCPYIYIHVHARTCDDGVTKKILWHPRISRPLSSENAMLFRCKGYSDEVEICWMIPDRCMWSQYKKGNIVEHNEVARSIGDFQSNKKKLDEPHPDDLHEEIGALILEQVKNALRQDKLMMESIKTMLERESMLGCRKNR